MICGYVQELGISQTSQFGHFHGEKYKNTMDLGVQTQT